MPEPAPDKRAEIEAKIAAVNAKLLSSIIEWAEFTRLHEERRELEKALAGRLPEREP